MIFCKVDNKLINSPFKVSDLSENTEKLKIADDTEHFKYHVLGIP